MMVRAMAIRCFCPTEMENHVLRPSCYDLPAKRNEAVGIRLDACLFNFRHPFLVGQVLHSRTHQSMFDVASNGSS